MTERLIDANALVNKMLDICEENCPSVINPTSGQCEGCTLWDFYKIIKAAPTIETKPIVTRNCDYCHNGTYRKSYCQPDGTFIRFANYCEVCGRDLIKKEGEL